MAYLLTVICLVLWFFWLSICDDCQ